MHTTNISMREAFNSVYPVDPDTDYLSGLSYAISNDLDGLFNFGTDSVFTVYSLGIPSHDEQYEKLVDKLCEIGVDRDTFENYMNNQDGFVVFTKRMGYKNNGVDIDYVVVLGGLSYITPLILGEEITHGEYILRHSRNPDYKSFLMNFSPAVQEFFGWFGNVYILYRLKNQIDELIGPHDGPLIDTRSLPKVNTKTGRVQPDYAHVIGYRAAKSYLMEVGNMDGIRNLFRMESEGEVWATVNNVLTPKVELLVPSYAEVDGLEEDLIEVAKDIGLEIKPEIIVDDSRNYPVLED